jgi:hypothetical protein
MRKPHTATGKDGKLDYAKQIRFDFEFAKQMILTDGTVVSMFVLRNATAINIVPATWQNDHEKANTMNAVKLLCLAMGANCLTFIGEAWMRSIHPIPGETKAEKEARIVAVPTAEAEDRIEIVAVQTTWLDDATGERHADITTGEIVRGANGKPASIKPFDSGVGRGRMHDILPDRILPEEERVALRARLEAAGLFKQQEIIRPS